MISIPQALVNNTLTRAGEEGRQWIDALPALAATLCEAWDLEIDGRPMHGYMGLVIPVVRDGEPCALKICGLNQSPVIEATALAAWNGNGAVRLLDVQPELGALLLERLDPGRTLDGLPIAEALAIAGRLLRRLAIPDPGDLPQLPEMAGDIAASLPERWQRVGRPFPEEVLVRAAETAERLAPGAADLMVNWDLHYLDVLAGEREPWLAVDPKVVIGDPEFGLAQLLWRRLEDFGDAGGLDGCFELLVETAELDAELARDWTLVRTVDYWLWAISVGLTGDPLRCRKVTRWLCGA